MTLLILGHAFHYEMENLARMFFPGDSLAVRTEGDPAAPYTITTRLERLEDGAVDILVRYNRDRFAADRTHWLAPGTPEEEVELAMGRCLYTILSKQTGITPPWGTITGVRPVRLLRSLEEKMGADRALKAMNNRYMPSPEKLELTRRILEAQRPVLAGAGRSDFSLYVSIPFCPSRCSYCSFVSHDIEGVKKLVPDYLKLLCREIIRTGRIATQLGLKLRTIYIGGGTPTVLEAPQLEQIMAAIGESFHRSALLEYTVEAGRPDTITPEKLAVLRRMGADRVSINPQTMDNDVLERIGRRHTAAQALDAFAMAREAGFDCVNMDLIAGLPGDSLAGFKLTVQQIADLRPENITVHTLTLKRSSRLREAVNPIEPGAGAMLEYAGSYLDGRGYLPYYLYRQKGTVENLENTGYALPGREGLYNIFIMEEVQTVLAVGAGAVTKLVGPDGAIQRVYNYKFPYEYIARFDEMLHRKSRVETILKEGWQAHERDH